MLSQLLNSVIFIDRLNRMQWKLVGVETFFFVGVEQSLRQGIFGDILIGFMCSECHFDRLHEPDIDKILIFDLVHEVADDIVHLSFHDNANKA